MREEIDALVCNQTWKLVDLPSSKKRIGCKWVFRVKFKSDGTIERHKAWLIVLIKKQKEGIDFNETFAPMAKMVSVRVFVFIATIKGWELHQMDVQNAFLHGDLTEEVYMKPPPGFVGSSVGKVCLLQRPSTSSTQLVSQVFLLSEKCGVCPILCRLLPFLFNSWKYHSSCACLRWRFDLSRK